MTNIRQINIDVHYAATPDTARITIDGPGHWARIGDEDNAAQTNALAELVSNLAPHAVELEGLVDEYTDWQTTRSEYAELDGQPEGPDSGDWQDSDDAGINLLHRIVDFLETKEA